MMKNRKRNRMQGFDYSKDAIYFITTCCKNRINHFGEIIDGKMQLNDYGKIAENQIEWLEKQYPYFELHNFVVMPNHVHILMEINRVGTGRDLSLYKNSDTDISVSDNLRTGRDPFLQQPMKIKSISSLMGAYKTTTSKQIHLLGNINFSWQRSFHDHIVRNEQRYNNILNYITDNPIQWKEDTFNTITNPNFDENE